jgi:peptide/nickel transport system substrate-binding protein
MFRRRAADEQKVTMTLRRSPNRRQSIDPAFVITVLATVMTCASGCRRDTGPPKATGFATTPLRLGVAQLSALNPSEGLRQLSQNLSVEALVRSADDGKLQPSLADSWQIAPDGKSVTIRLRPGVKFHDDSVLTAEQVVKILPTQLRAFMGPVYDDVGEIAVAGTDSLTINFRQPAPFLMEGLEAQIRKPGPVVVGTGAYVVAPDSPLEMKANKSYYLGAPTIDQIRVTNYPNARAAWAEMLRDRIDMLYEVGLDALDSMETSSNVSVFTFTRRFQYLIALNSKAEVLKSPEVRRALNIAIDRAAIVTAALGGHGLVSKGPVWERHWAFPAGWTNFEFNPQLAIKTFSAKPLRFTCLVPPDAVYERLALGVKQQLANIGVEMVVEEAPVDRLMQAVQGGTFEAALMEGNSGPTLFRAYSLWHSGGSFNPGGLGNPTLDTALDRLRPASSDDDYRRAVSGILQAYMNDPPAIFLAFSERARAVSRRFIVPAAEPGRDILSTLRLWKPVGDSKQASRN